MPGECCSRLAFAKPLRVIVGILVTLAAWIGLTLLAGLLRGDAQGSAFADRSLMALLLDSALPIAVLALAVFLGVLAGKSKKPGNIVTMVVGIGFAAILLREDKDVATLVAITLGVALAAVGALQFRLQGGGAGVG